MRAPTKMKQRIAAPLVSVLRFYSVLITQSFTSTQPSVLSSQRLRQLCCCGCAHMQPKLRSAPKDVFCCAGPLMARKVIDFSFVKAAAEICAESSHAVGARKHRVDSCAIRSRIAVCQRLGQPGKRALYI